MGKAHQPEVCRQLQVEAQPPLLARPPWFMLRGRLMGGSGEAGIPAASPASASYEEAVAGRREVVQFFTGVGVIDDRAYRRQNIDRFAFMTGAIAAFAMPASLGLVLGIEAEVQQSVLVWTCDQENIAAAAAIAAAGSAARDKFFAAKSQAAVAAIACFDVDTAFVADHVSNEVNA